MREISFHQPLKKCFHSSLNLKFTGEFPTPNHIPEHYPKHLWFHRSNHSLYWKILNTPGNFQEV